MRVRFITVLGSAALLLACGSERSESGEAQGGEVGVAVGEDGAGGASNETPNDGANDADDADEDDALADADVTDDAASDDELADLTDDVMDDAARDDELADADDELADLTDDELANVDDELADLTDDELADADDELADLTDDELANVDDELAELADDELADAEPDFVIEEEAEVLLDPAELPAECEAGTPGCGCESVLFSVGTRASCDMRLVPGAELDGAGFLHVDDGDHLIFTMNRWGAGHIIGWCDSDSAVEMMDSFPGWEYLAQTEAPRIAAMGSHWGCELNVSYPFWGNQMPAEYVGNPARLAEDWDVIMLCGFHMGVDPDGVTTPANGADGWPADLKPTLTSFVKEHGKGLFLVMDYFGTVVKDYDIENVNDIVRDAGFEILPNEVAWGEASAAVALDCVPDVPGRVR